MRDNKGGYNTKDFYNNRQSQGNSNLENAKGDYARRDEKKYQYYQPQYATQYEPRRTITIYEDPREFGGYNNNGNYGYPTPYNKIGGYTPDFDTGLVQLDYRQPAGYFYPRPFDYYKK